MNPILSQNKNVQNIAKIIYDPLITLTSDYKAEGVLAKEWAKQDNSYLIKLKENIKWPDGGRFTAEDVLFTIDRLKEVDSIYSYQVQKVVSVEIVDDYTVKINLESETPFFEYNLTFPILSKEYFENEDFLTTEKNNYVVGTGKYQISEVQSSYITLEKNSRYWNKETNFTLEKIIINLYSSVGEMYNSFKIGNIDLISTDNENLQEYIGTIGYSSKEMKGREHTFLALNMQNAFLSRQEIRKAISYSIDKGNIVSDVYGNKSYTSSFPLDYGNWLGDFQDVSSGYNAEHAKQILIENEWVYRNKYWQKIENYKTQRLQLNMLVKSSNGKHVAVAENIKAQLEAQGIRINIVYASDEKYTEMLNSKSYDIALCKIILATNPSLQTFFGEGNLANYYNEEVMNLMNEVKNTTDEKILKERYKRLNEIYKIDIPYISLCSNKYIVAYNSGLVGDINPNWYNQFYGVESWYK